MNSGITASGRDRMTARLLEQGLIDEAQLAKAKEIQKKDGGTLGQALVRSGMLDESSYVENLGQVHNLPVVDLDSYDVALECIDLIPGEVATKFQVLPISRRGRILTVAMANPANIFAIDDIKFITGLDVQPVVAGEVAIKKSIDKFYATTDSLASIMEGLEDDIELVEEQDDDDVLGQEGQNAPVVKLVNTLLAEAVKVGASDIHVECYEKQHAGTLPHRRRAGRGVMEPPIKMKNAIISA
jgi:type IV pilus assembly protein PilB